MILKGIIRWIDRRLLIPAMFGMGNVLAWALCIVLAGPDTNYLTFIRAGIGCFLAAVAAGILMCLTQPDGRRVALRVSSMLAFLLFGGGSCLAVGTGLLASEGRYTFYVLLTKQWPAWCALAGLVIGVTCILRYIICVERAFYGRPRGLGRGTIVMTFREARPDEPR